MSEDIGPEPHESATELAEHAEHEHAHGSEHGKAEAKPKKKSVLWKVKSAGILVVMLVVALAICNNQSSDYETKSMQTSIEKNDSWLQWNDKSNKGTVWEVAGFLLDALKAPFTVDTLKVTHKIGDIVGVPLTEAQREQIADVVNHAANEASDTRIDAAAKKAEGKVKYYEGKKTALEDASKELTTKSREQLELHEKYKNAATNIQIAVAMIAAVVIFSSIAWLCSLMFYFGIGLASVGLVAAAAASGWITIAPSIAHYLTVLGIGIV